MYIRDTWYVAAFAEEVNRIPMHRTLLDEPVVLYRTETGNPVALSDVCPHRRAPLHLGKLAPIPRVDMRFDMRWNPPSCLLLEIGAASPGQDKSEGVTAWVSHLLTPETETTTHYFWTFTRDSKLDDDGLSERLRTGISQAFMAEDAPIIEWQQRYAPRADQTPAPRRLLPGDRGGARARLVVERILAAASDGGKRAVLPGKVQ